MIYELISDICISMKAVDYLDMPECVYTSSTAPVCSTILCKSCLYQ